MSTAKQAEITTHLITDLLSKEHPDVAYLRQDNIALTLSRCLSETFTAKPKAPIEYFAKVLLQQSQTQHRRNAVSKYDDLNFSKLKEKETLEP